MPDLKWKNLSNIKHALSEERTIVCGIIIRLKNLDIDHTVERLEKIDKRLQELEDQLVDIIELAGKEENGL